MLIFDKILNRNTMELTLKRSNKTLKISKLIILGLMVFTANISFGGTKKIEIGGDQNDAEIYANGKLQGKGSVIVQIRKNSSLNIEIKKIGYFTEKFYIEFNKGRKPNKTYYSTLIRDDAFDASSLTDIANNDISLISTHDDEKTWRLIAEVVTSYFDVLEVSDKSSGYIRTSWESKTFKESTIRTRVIIKISNADNLPSYKIKIVSEIANKPNVSVKNDESFSSWGRVLKKYDGVVSELQSRLK